MMQPVAVPAVRGLLRRPLQTTLLVFALSIALAATMTIMAVLAGVDVQMREDLQRVGLDYLQSGQAQVTDQFIAVGQSFREVLPGIEKNQWQIRRDLGDQGQEHRRFGPERADSGNAALEQAVNGLAYHFFGRPVAVTVVQPGRGGIGDVA